MTDVVSPSPKNNRRLLIIVAAVAVVIIALIVGTLLYASSAAGSKASDYGDDYAAWKAKDKPILLAAAVKVPEGTYLSKDPTTTKALEKQKKGCDAVATSRKKLTAAAGRLPTMGSNGLLGKLSSDYSDAGDKSAQRSKVVQAYVKSASAALAQIERDCRWNIKYNASVVKPNKLWASSDKYAVKPGGTEPGGIFCDKNSGGCVSSITKKKNKYADLRVRAIKLYQARIAKFYGPKECRATSYGSACGVLLRTSDAYQKLRLKNYKYVRTMKTSVNNDNLDKHNKTLDKLYDRNLPKIRKAVLALDPTFKKDKDLRNSPRWSDHFFAQMGKLGLADLKDDRAAIEKL